MNGLTWTCHVCGQERPDAAISVWKHEVTMRSGIKFTENVRYCNDNPKCISGAKEVHFIDASSA